MGVSAGGGKSGMGNLSQRDLFTVAVRRPKGNAVNLTQSERHGPEICPTYLIFSNRLQTQKQPKTARKF